MRKLKERVLQVLKRYPETRRSYKLLETMIWEKEMTHLDISMSQFLYVYGSPYYKDKISSSSSIRRICRSLFNEYPYLRDKDMYDYRHNVLAEEYRKVYKPVYGLKSIKTERKFK